MPAPAATRDQLELVHTSCYLDKVFAGPIKARWNSDGSDSRGPQAWPAEANIPPAARWPLRVPRWTTAPVSTWQVARIMPLPMRDKGFCVFNDVAVATRVLQWEKRIERSVGIGLRCPSRKWHSAHLREG